MTQAEAEAFEQMKQLREVRKRLFRESARISALPYQGLTKEGIYFEAEHKLQNSLRVTLNVESFMTEVKASDDVWMPVSEYVQGLIEYIREGGTTS